MRRLQPGELRKCGHAYDPKRSIGMRPGKPSGGCRVCKTAQVLRWHTQSLNRIRVAERARVRYHKDPSILLAARARARHAATGWTTIAYRGAFAAQKGRCALCGRHASEFKKALCADHCHQSKTTRALLCTNCNMGLGNFQDDPDLMRRAIAYIEKHRLALKPAV